MKTVNIPQIKSDAVKALRKMMSVRTKCPSCQQKAKVGFMIDLYHEVGYCGQPFCRDRLIKWHRKDDQVFSDQQMIIKASQVGKPETQEAEIITKMYTGTNEKDGKEIK